jgi:YNFM family putative membrane transporter
VKTDRSFALQILVFSLVCAAFTTIYITQPVLPVLQREFRVDETRASYTIAAVILGIALSTLPFGILADRYPIRPIIMIGGLVVSACGFLSAIASNLSVLIVSRFIQGLFIPSLTTCIAAYLARTLPRESLNVVMGSYISATVTGGLGGRLLGGWVHPPLHWRYAFVSASILLLAATVAAFRWLPREKGNPTTEASNARFTHLLKKLLPFYLVAFGAFFVFSSIFNYLPFYLSGPPFHARTEVITLMYLSYVIGIIIAPLAGKLSNRIGNGSTMILGALIFGLSIGVTLIRSMAAIMVSLTGICAGFFAIHAAAAGALNRRLSDSRGRANSIYVLFYYLGGTIGITLSGYAYGFAGWLGVTTLGWTMLLIPFGTGISERLKRKDR